MPIYYIDVTDGDRAFLDESGGEMPGFAQARSEAIDTLVGLFHRQLEGIVERVASTAVRDATGSVLFKATLSFKATDHRMDYHRPG